MTNRKSFTLKDKIEMLDKIKSSPPGTTQRQLSKEFGVSQATITRFLKEESSLREDLSKGMSKNLKRRRMGKDANVERALVEWYWAEQAKGKVLTGPALKAKAEELGAEMGREFCATNGWLTRWKVRFNIKLKKAHDKGSSTGETNSEPGLFGALPGLLKGYGPGEIYSADKTSLLYRAAPDGSLDNSCQSVSGSQRVSEHIVVLCCANVTGKDKRKLLVIGKSKTPHCLKDPDVDNLPVIYRTDCDARLTADVFVEWLMDWDGQLEREGRRILLLLNTCSAHPHLKKLKNIRLEYPPHTSSCLLPMNAGVIEMLKMLYRQELVHRIQSNIENNVLKQHSTAAKVSPKITVLDAIYSLAKSWRAISETTIHSSFLKCGLFSVAEETTVVKLEDNSDTEVPKNVVMEDEGATENETPNHSEAVGKEETVQRMSLCKQEKLSITEEPIDDGNDTETAAERVPSNVSHAEAMQSIFLLYRYATQQGMDNSVLSDLDRLSAEVRKNAHEQI